MGFLGFAQDRVQVAVVEVSLGGRLDATNVVEPLACALAPIALEHTKWLGPTLAHVAAEKAGILKIGAPAVSAGRPRAVAGVLQARARELGIPLWRPGRDYVYESSDVRPFCYAGPDGARVSLDALALPGHHQRGNAALACALLQAAAGRGLPVGLEHVREGLRTARWPARLEVVAERPLVLLDGAHNAHAPRAAAPEQLAALARGLGRESCAVYLAVREALQAAREAAGPDGCVLCCGSLYLAAEVQAALRGRPAARMPSERL